jgi:MYXO-CTERM domain-containing protein
VLYRDGVGAVSYGRQDGALVGNNDLLQDVTVLSASGRNPTLSRPPTASGCYVAAYTDGNTIRRRGFTANITTLSPEATLYTTSVAPTSLSAELEPESAPALVWQEGGSIMFGFAAGGPPATLTATPDTVPADSSSMIDVASTPFVDACGNPLPAGTLVTVTTTLGSIADADASAAFAGTQVPADAQGRVSFRILAGDTGGQVVVAAMPVTGGDNASTLVTFTGGPGPISPTCGDGIVDVDNGEQCDSAGTDTPTCNAADCLPARCGDGYLNLAADEECEQGELCDVTACRYRFTLGGGCVGCSAPGSSSSAWLAGLVAVALGWRRRRKRRPPPMGRTRAAETRRCSRRSRRR